MTTQTDGRHEGFARTMCKDDLPLYAIKAVTGEGRSFTCFDWRGYQDSGIARAKREAVDFGMTDLHDFTAVLVQAGATG